MLIQREAPLEDIRRHSRLICEVCFIHISMWCRAKSIFPKIQSQFNLSLFSQELSDYQRIFAFIGNPITFQKDPNTAKRQIKKWTLVMQQYSFLLLLAFLQASQGINKNTGQDPKPIYDRRGGYQKALQVEISSAFCSMWFWLHWFSCCRALFI